MVRFHLQPCVRSITVNALVCGTSLCQFKSDRTPRPYSSVIERILGKNEVMSLILIEGFGSSYADSIERRQLSGISR